MHNFYFYFSQNHGFHNVFMNFYYRMTYQSSLTWILGKKPKKKNRNKSVGYTWNWKTPSCSKSTNTVHACTDEGLTREQARWEIVAGPTDLHGKSCMNSSQCDAIHHPNKEQVAYGWLWNKWESLDPRRLWPNSQASQFPFLNDIVYIESMIS